MSEFQRAPLTRDSRGGRLFSWVVPKPSQPISWGPAGTNLGEFFANSERSPITKLCGLFVVTGFFKRGKRNKIEIKGESRGWGQRKRITRK